MNSPPARMKDQVWPADGLEHAPDCPVCGSSTRTLLHQGLSDRIFFVAPGQWALWQCQLCRSAWLDPRPTQATIGIAYGRYYTHGSTELPSPRNAFERVRAALANGYRNARYGTNLRPAAAAGRLFVSVLPVLGWPVDIAYRYLPARRAGESGRVLDIGCGNGAWLRLAQDAGWQAAGVEPDPVARGEAEKTGLEVRHLVDDWLDQPGSFDVVTMSHVIEHVHDPLALLRVTHSLLRPGGQIFVDTPNIDAVGHKLYGPDWRGLEPPRHLVLFNRASLSDALERTGFRKVRFPRRYYPFKGMCEQSRRIEAGQDPYSTAPVPGLSPMPGVVHALRAMFGIHTEFLTAVAIRPA